MSPILKLKICVVRGYCQPKRNSCPKPNCKRAIYGQYDSQVQKPSFFMKNFRVPKRFKPYTQARKYHSLVEKPYFFCPQL